METSTSGEVVWKGFMQAHEQLIMRPFPYHREMIPFSHEGGIEQW
jgi:hypothetical protein